MRKLINQVRKKYYRVAASRWIPQPISGLLLTEGLVKYEVRTRKEVE